MGATMAGHFLARDHALTVLSRTRSKAEGLLQRGARWADSPARVADESDVVFTMVGFPKDVFDVYLGEEGLVHQARAGMVFVDMTTAPPSLAGTIAEAVKVRGAHFLDAPVSGGDVGARNASLSIMGAEKPASWKRFGRFSSCWVRPLSIRVRRAPASTPSSAIRSRLPER